MTKTEINLTCLGTHFIKLKRAYPGKPIMSAPVAHFINTPQQWLKCSKANPIQAQIGQP